MGSTFQVMAYIQGVRTLVDGGCKLDVITRELDPASMALLFAVKGQEAAVLFKTGGDVTKEEAMELPAPGGDERELGYKPKTKAQRLRAVIYRDWEQNTDRSKWPQFEDYYDQILESLIAKVKERLI